MKWLKEYLSAEREKIGQLTDRRAKTEYIWQYYKLWIIGIVCAVWFLSFAVYRAATAVTENWIYVIFTNTHAEVGNDSPLWKGFVEYSGFDTKEKNVMFNNNSYFDYAKNQGIGNKYYETFVAYADAGVLDCVTMEQENLEALGASGRLMDLSLEECGSILEKYGDRLVYCEPYDEEYSDGPVPVGIDLSDTCLVEEYHIYQDSCVLGISAHTQNLEAVEVFLDYIMEESSR